MRSSCLPLPTSGHCSHAWKSCVRICSRLIGVCGRGPAWAYARSSNCKAKYVSLLILELIFSFIHSCVVLRPCDCQGAGRGADQSATQQARGNRRWLADMAIRLICVLALDRFGDFASDQAVAPVRDVCAQVAFFLSLANFYLIRASL